MIEHFHFIRPLWLFALLPLLLLVPWWRVKSTRQHVAEQIIAPHLQANLLSKALASKPFPWKLAALLWLLFVTAAAGPAWLEQPMPVSSQDRGYVILFDASLDTRASDVSPDRHTRLKYKALDLIQELRDAQVGIVAYSGDAFTVSPLTRDAENLAHLLPALSPEIMPVPGRNPLAGFQAAHEMLIQAGYDAGDIYWFSGSIDRTDMEDIRTFLRTHPHRVSALIAGTEDGSPVRTEQGDLLRTPQGELVIPRVYRSYFEQIVGGTNGILRTITTDNSDIESLLALPEQSAQETEALSLKHDQWVDMGPYLLWLTLPLLVVFSRRTQLLNLVLPVIISSALLASLPEAVAAAPDHNSQRVALLEPVLNSFRNREQKALRAYQQHNFAEARTYSDNPMINGMAAYRAEDYEEAVRYFESIDTAEAHYNRGNSLAYIGELEDAIAAYEQALAQRPNWTQALENKELIESLQQDQQNNEDSQQQNDPNEQSEQNQQSDQSQQNSEGEQTEQDESTEQSQQSEQSEQSEHSEQNQDDENEPAEESEQETEPSSEESLTQQTIPEAWEDLSEEERAQLEQLLRRLPDDPALLLRNRLRLEAERRRLRQFN